MILNFSNLNNFIFVICVYLTAGLIMTKLLNSTILPELQTRDRLSFGKYGPHIASQKLIHWQSNKDTDSTPCGFHTIDALPTPATVSMTHCSQQMAGTVLVHHGLNLVPFVKHIYHTTGVN